MYRMLVKKKILGPEYRARATEGMGEKDENLRREVAGEAGINPDSVCPRLCPSPAPRLCDADSPQLS